MKDSMILVDVLCVGHACYDLVFSIPRHPEEDEKIFADSLIGCGGGPAANAAVTVSRLGYQSAFAGYLGNDIFGTKHIQELTDERVSTELIVRGSSPTPLSTILVKPDGKRALINFKGATRPLPDDSVDFSTTQAKVILFDGHEPHLSISLAKRGRNENIPTVLDAGSLHDGTLALMGMVDFLVCSEKFARQFTKVNSYEALSKLAEISPAVVITLGEKGLVWQCGSERGELPAIPITAVDTTGAGDAFHGAFAAAVSTGSMGWQDILGYASAAGSFCCTQMGARPALPNSKEVYAMLHKYK
jgi:sulfofructose kinase